MLDYKPLVTPMVPILNLYTSLDSYLVDPSIYIQLIEWNSYQFQSIWNHLVKHGLLLLLDVSSEYHRNICLQ